MKTFCKRYTLPRRAFRLVWLTFALTLLLALPGSTAPAPPPAAFTAALEKLPADLRQNANLLVDLEALFTAYGPAIKGVEANTPQQVFLLMGDGQKILYDDGRIKSGEEKLNHPDLEDMLSQPYQPGKPTTAPPPDHDPGRIRVEPFFAALYGGSAGQVQGHLVRVDFAGTRASFNGRQGAAAALEKVGGKLKSAIGLHPSLKAWVFPLGGTYNRRQIAGTDRLSPHSWGIAIDLRKGTYWRWGKLLGPAELLALQSAYPGEIVAAFEEQGFIWGGKWHHYDTMHFEYRPELLAKARLLAARAGK